MISLPRSNYRCGATVVGGLWMRMITCAMCLVSAAQAEFLIESERVLQTPEVPLRFPTDVAVLADGQVIVADGVNNRVVEFRSE
ncbi:MAG: hypothetical protein AB7N71_09840, partial [Phycisphaerae bacterium]